MFNFFETDDHPERVILTDDPLRVRMLAAHHLDNAGSAREQGDAVVYIGSYGQTAIALVAVGLENGAVSEFIRGAGGSGITEVVYIGSCAGTTEKQALRTVVLADGGCRELLESAQKAAVRHGIPVVVGVVSPKNDIAQEFEGITDEVTNSFYKEAHTCGVKALSVLTVSENTMTGEKMEEHERRSRFYPAALLVFETLNH